MALPKHIDIAKLQVAAGQACNLLKVLSNPDRLLLLCQMAHGEFAVAALCGLLPGVVLAAAGLLLWPVLAGAALGAFAAAAWLGAKCVARIGGYTGDCLGAVQQLAEVVIYLAVVAGLQQGAWQ